MFTLPTVKALLSLREHNADVPFYASDFGFSGGVMNALASSEVICETGNTKEYTIPHPYDNHLLIKCQSKEWTINTLNLDTEVRLLRRTMKEMREAVAQWEALGL